MKLEDTISPREDPAGQLAQMLADLHFEDIPEEHIEYAKKDIFDALGCLIAGTTGPTVPTVLEMIRDWNCTGSSPVIVFGTKLPPTLAALANGTIARACDLGDTHNRGGHICEWIVPTLLTGLSLTARPISGKEFLTAFVGGAEWGAREHVCIHLQYHTTITPGECAGSRYATGALAKMLGLDKEQIWNAQGLAYSSKPQSEQQKYNEGMPMVRLQHGYVCSDAVASVSLAQRGVEGVKGIYMGSGGLLKNIKHGDLEPVDFLVDGLGERWVWREEVTMKPYAGCKYNHTPIYGLLRMMDEYRFSWREIDAVHYTVSNGCRCTIEPKQEKWNPRTPAEALFSNPYSVAFAAVTGDCFLDAYEQQVIDEKMNSPEFRDLMSRLSYEVDPSLPPFDGYTIRLRLKDGRTFEKVENELLGNVVNPMTWEQVEEKFRKCARYSARQISEEACGTISRLCRNMEEIPDMRQLLQALLPETP